MLIINRFIISSIVLKTYDHAATEALLYAMSSQIRVTRRLPSIAVAARTSGSLRLGGSVHLLQRRHLCIQCGSLLRARFGRGQDPAGSGWPAPKQREDVHRATP